MLPRNLEPSGGDRCAKKRLLFKALGTSALCPKRGAQKREGLSADADWKGFPREPKVSKIKRSSRGKEKGSPCRDLSRTNGVDVREWCV